MCLWSLPCVPTQFETLFVDMLWIFLCLWSLPCGNSHTIGDILCGYFVDIPLEFRLGGRDVRLQAPGALLGPGVPPMSSKTIPKPSKSHPKVTPKSPQSHPKVIPKSSQSHPKVIPMLTQSQHRVNPGSTRGRPRVGPKSTPDRPKNRSQKDEIRLNRVRGFSIWPKSGSR